MAAMGLTRSGGHIYLQLHAILTPFVIGALIYMGDPVVDRLEAQVILGPVSPLCLALLAF